MPFPNGSDTSLFRILDARFAYKYYDVQLDYSSGRSKTLTAKTTLLLNLDISAPNGEWTQLITTRGLNESRQQL